MSFGEIASIVGHTEEEVRQKSRDLETSSHLEKIPGAYSWLCHCTSHNRRVNES
jgi:hypothetical protein